MDQRRLRHAIAGVLLSAQLHAAGDGATLRRVFVTSVAGNGDLDSWNLPVGVPPIPPGVQGVAAGDYICAVLALRAGLSDPGSFTAWLSDSDDDAFCRILGRRGRKNDDCGEASLNAEAGPWARPDDLPFAESLLAIATGSPSVVSSPVAFDESGDLALNLAGEAWTGTNTGGTATTDNCFDWRSSAAHDSGVFGSSLRTVDHWTAAPGVRSCDRLRRLLCVQRGIGPAPPSPARGGRFAFATSTVGNGDLGSWPDAGDTTGIAAGDAICRAHAARGGLAFPESFKAWLSDESTDARDRFSSGPWMRLDGFPLAASLAGLTDGSLTTAIDRDEHGRPTAGIAWTGTLASGTGADDNCGDWTADAIGVEGRPGVVVSISNDWTALPQLLSCANNLRLYCLSDASPALLFADGFESGVTRLWSATQGSLD
jgi:hypothetical protein